MLTKTTEWKSKEYLITDALAMRSNNMVTEMNSMDTWLKRIEEEKKVKKFLASLGKVGEIADKVSDLILFHNRVRENAEKRYI